MSTIRCPRCRSEAYYNYGHTKNGKQRYICLVCNRQFVNGESGKAVQQRPGCPFYGKRMHVYMRDLNFIRVSKRSAPFFQSWRFNVKLFLQVWMEDIRYYYGCGFFDARRPPDYRRLNRFGPEEECNGQQNQSSFHLPTQQRAQPNRRGLHEKPVWRSL